MYTIKKIKYMSSLVCVVYDTASNNTPFYTHVSSYMV